jgi:hypothetical protein
MNIEGLSRSRQDLKRILLKRVFNGESSLTLLEMWSRIKGALERGRKGGETSDILDPLAQSLSGGKIKNWQMLEETLAPTTSKYLRAYNLVAVLEGRPQLIETPLIPVAASAPQRRLIH